MATRLGYARVSSDNQNLETQLFLFQQEKLDELFVEKISGRREDRPELTRLCDRALALAKSGESVEVLFVEFSRWGRNTSYALKLVETLELAGVKIREIRGTEISVATSSGLLNTGMKALLAHYYSVQLSERVKRAYDRRRAEGRPLCGNPPLGYRWAADHSQIEPDPATWPIARAIVDRMLRGDSKYSICKWLLEDHDIRRSADGINRLCRSEAWRGHIVDRKHGRLLRDTHPALITEDEYQALERRLAINRQLRGANQGKVYAIPSSGGGIVRCATCGFAETTSTTQGRRYFRCVQHDCPSRQKYLRSEVIEAAIQEAIVEAAEAVADATLAATTEATLDPRVVQLEDELQQLTGLAHRPAVALEIQQIEAELAQLKAAPTLDAVGAAERRDLIQSLAALTSEDWEVLSSEEKRELYGALVERVVVEGHQIVEVRLRG
jgi:DNA invertase Pin-like site-specific DNA recombinase